METASTDRRAGAARSKGTPPDRQLSLPWPAPARGGSGLAIAFSVIDTPLGKLLVGASSRGVCAAHLGDDEAQLVAELRRDHPRAAIAAAGDRSPREAAAVLACLRGDAAPSEVALDLHGTPFQLRVWERVKQIPRGATTSYVELARSLGQPSGARAVARAVATNPVALLIPCHRVIRSDGGLADYRWGRERKKRLLEMERGG